MWTHILAVAVGGAAGSVARFLVAKGSESYLGAAFPYATLIVNVVGSFILGFITQLAVNQVGSVPTMIKLMIGVGFCGAFTTFSTFAVETVTEPMSIGMLNLFLNNAMSIGAAAIGIYAAMRIWS